MIRSLFILSTCLVTIQSPVAAQAGADTTAWLADFGQLKREMSDHYANLEWAVSARRMDLPALAAATERALRVASSESAARSALEGFIRAFGDGHLEIRWPAAPSSQTAGAPPAPKPQGVCARNGYVQRTPSRGLAFDRLTGFKRIDSDDARYFPLGILDVAGRRVAILRIASFEDNVFADLCERAATALAIAPDSNCADGCAEQLDRETSNNLTDALTRQIRRAQAEKIDALIVDLTRNGGGTNWVEAAARVLTPIALKAPRAAFVRHAHHVAQLASTLESLRADSAQAPRAARPLLGDAIRKVARAKEQAEQACDRNPLWEGKPLKCSGLVTDARFATGLLDYARPGEIPQLANCCALFYPARYRYEEGVYRGRLYVLIDRGTASAAEYFAAILRDNNAARLIGEPSYGAGCGYTNGGIRTTLQFSGAVVRMPDCVRYRADGTNEVDGITPDVLVPWRPNDSEYQKMEKTVRAIASSLD